MDSMDSIMDSQNNVYKYVCEKCNYIHDYITDRCELCNSWHVYEIREGI